MKELSILMLYLMYCKAANILYVVPFTSKSHDIFFRPIGLELARRGHNVTVITSFDVPDPPQNYHKIVIERKELWELIGTERMNTFETIEMKATELIDIVLWKAGLAFTEHILNSTQMQSFLRKENRYDLVISEIFVQEATLTLAHKYNAPLVLITAFGNCMRHNIAVGNPLQLAHVLYEFVPVEKPTSFFGRLKNLYVTVYEYFWWRYWYLKEQEALSKKYISDLPESIPSLYDIQQNASLILINSHFSFNTPKAYFPNVIEIGGVHITSNAEKLQIPKDIKKMLNESNHGVVYVNFGTNIKSSEMPAEKKNAFISVFGRLKQIVLWKWEEDNMQGLPPNVIIKPWFPQNKILEHPNIRLFIGHGGIMSTEEAVFHGVPILGIPIYGDQYNNLLLIEEAGFGKILEYRDIDEKTIEKAINDILQNRSYLLRAKEMSKRWMDRPMNPLDTAMYWIEYVIRNKGANYMKSPVINIHWLAYNMIDVYLFILAIAATILCIKIKMFLILMKIFNLRRNTVHKNIRKNQLQKEKKF